MKNVNDFKIGLIYKYTSPSGKIYIGQTINEKIRKSKHKIDSKIRKTYFANAIRKYGFENFIYEVIIKFKSTSDIAKLKRVLNKLEQRYIKLYKSNNNNFGYNLNIGGEGNIGYKHSKEMIEYLKTISKTKEQLDNLTLGRTECSEKTKQKHRETQKGRMKRVGKFDLENNLLEEFECIADAARTITSEATQKTKSSRIGECCNNKRKTAFGII